MGADATLVNAAFKQEATRQGVLDMSSIYDANAKISGNT